MDRRRQRAPAAAPAAAVSSWFYSFEAWRNPEQILQIVCSSLRCSSPKFYRDRTNWFGALRMSFVFFVFFFHEQPPALTDWLTAGVIKVDELTILF